MSDDDRSPKLISMTLVGEDEIGELHECVLEIGGKVLVSTGRFRQPQPAATLDVEFAGEPWQVVGLTVPVSGFELPEPAEFQRGYVDTDDGGFRSETDEELAERIKRALEKP